MQSFDLNGQSMQSFMRTYLAKWRAMTLSPNLALTAIEVEMPGASEAARNSCL